MHVFLIMLFSITPIADDPNSITEATQGAIRFEWPADMGGVDECKKFMQGSAFWHPHGEIHAVGNCTELEGSTG